MKRKNEKSRGRKFLWLLICCLSMGLISYLPADTSARISFSLDLKEWLVLEIKSGGLGISDTGNHRALGQTEIVCGQPLEVRVLLSVSESQTVALKGIIYHQAQDNFEQSVLAWHGQGDLRGEGLVMTGQENILAVWHGRGLKTGSLVFEDTENNQRHSYKATFTLSAI